MSTVSSDEALERIRRAPGSIVAFDCDGTLWSGDVGDDWFDQLLDHEGLLPVAIERAREEARAAGVPADGEPADLLRALVAATHAGHFNEQQLYSMVAWAAAGRTPDDVLAIIDRALERFGLEERVLPETRAILDGALALDIPIIAVSASPAPVIERSLARMGVRAEAVCAGRPATARGALLPYLEAPLPYGVDKVRALERVSRGRPVSVALGDSPFDLAMLLHAELGLMVRPKPSLRSLADQHPTVRELTPTHGAHELVLDFVFTPSWRRGRASTIPLWLLADEAGSELTLARERLSPLFEQAADGSLDHWNASPAAALARALLHLAQALALDHDSPRALDARARAARTAADAVARGFDLRLAWAPRACLYLALAADPERRPEAHARLEALSRVHEARELCAAITTRTRATPPRHP
jgi:phosphoserine phosphatase/uncharacterized protein (DUF924 family)